jgi:hypothetical protein
MKPILNKIINKNKKDYLGSYMIGKNKIVVSKYKTNSKRFGIMIENMR